MLDNTNSLSFSSNEEEILYLRQRTKELELTLQQQQSTFQALYTLASQSPDFIFWKDKNLHVLGYNKAVGQLIEKSGEPSVTAVFGKVPSLVDTIVEVVKSGKPAERQFAEVVIGKDAVTLQYAVYPYFTESGQTEGIICIASAVNQPPHTTSRKDTSSHTAIRVQELTHANEQLKKVNTDLDNFIYTASHDLRSPIANLEGLVTLLSKSLEHKLDAEDQTMFNMMQKAISRFKSTINDLTQIISIDKDFAEGSETLDFSDLAEHVQTDIGQLITESGATITLDAQVRNFRFARKNLRSIVYNLLVNAIKYRSPQRPLRIHMQTRQEGPYTVLSVQDNGLGIRADQKDKLFAMFHRVHTHIQGTGIGLYVVKRIVDNNKGKIEVDSEVGQGTTFHVYLLSDADTAPTEARNAIKNNKS
jgi:signal transduction histidine kinase